MEAPDEQLMLAYRDGNAKAFETLYVPQARFTTWLYTIAHHRMVDHWRRGGLSLVELDDQDPPGDSPDPARQLEAREALARFAQALEALPVAQREAFLLREE